MTQAERIIQFFGGTRRMAAAMGKSPSTVQRWKDSGFIPSRHHEETIARARAKGVALTPNDFFDLPAEGGGDA